MSRYSLRHLSDHVLSHDLAISVGRERASTAEVLAHIAEFDARQLYRGAAYPSMTAYCIGELHLSEDATAKRLQAAHVARRFPVVFDLVADGRLHLSGVNLLAPYLREGNAKELLAAATHKSKAEIDKFLAERFPKTDVLALVTAIPAASPAPGQVMNGLAAMAGPAPGHIEPADDQNVPANSTCPGAGPRRGQVTPLSTKSYAVQFTMSARAHDLLQSAKELLGHEIPSGDMGEIVEKALELLVPVLEKRKFAATSNPRPTQWRRSANPRSIPAEVKRAVWQRDGGQCTFVSEGGKRCPSKSRLEFDHVIEVARGGEATVAGLRLRCRAHNQYTAECTFGAEFIRQKRIGAAEARAAQRVARESTAAQLAAQAASRERKEAAAAAKQAAEAASRGREAAAAKQAQEEVVPWLRSLGFSASESCRAAALCADMPDAPLEQRVRRALTCFRVRETQHIEAAGAQCASQGLESV